MKKIRLRLPAIILLGTTILFWSLYDRHKPAGAPLLQHPTLATASAVRGDAREVEGRFILNVPTAGKTAEVRFELPTATNYPSIRVRGRVKVDHVVAGAHPWNCARLLLVQYDAKGKWISGPHGMLAEKGSKDWKKQEEVFEISPETVRAVVVLQQTGTSGGAQFDGIEAQPVRIRTDFVWWRIVFAALWLGAAIFYFPRCRLHRRRLKVLIFLNAVAILVGTLMPSYWIDDVSEEIKDLAARIEAPAPPPSTPPVQAASAAAKKPDQESNQMDLFNQMVGGAHLAGHFVLFATLCFLVYLSAALERQHPAYFIKVGADILLFAAVSEALQFLTIDRKAGILDLRIDVYGMALALIVFLAVLPVVRWIQRAKP